MKIITGGLIAALALSTLSGRLLPVSAQALAQERGAQAGTELVFGMSTALTGPAADLGQGMRAGMLAAFEGANRRGGIKGRAMRLVALDDGYEPDRTVPNVRELLERKVLGVVGNVGTPTAIAAIPLTMRARTPFFGAFTGAGVLRRTPPDRYVINYRASYAEETAAMVDALIEKAHIAPEEIAFFTQRDGYGDAGFNGGVQALKRHGLKDELAVPHGRYERNTSVVEGGLAEIISAPIAPRAVILVGTYKPCASFIKLAREVGLDVLFLNVSFVGATSLAKELGEAGDGVIMTQVVPHFGTDLAINRDYARDMQAMDKDWEPGFGSLEGYIAGRILCKALSASKQGIEGPADVVRCLEALGKFRLGLGVPLELSAERHQASASIWPTILRDGMVHPFAWSDLETTAGSVRAK